MQAGLSPFAFLIGHWRGEATFWPADGDAQRFQVAWRGHSILDGYAIADEYRMVDASGKLVVLGMNFRVYDAAGQTWNLKWLDALAGTWTDLTSAELGGIEFDGNSIVYAFKESMVSHAYTRATYTKLSETHFTWRGERSEDVQAWTEFMVVDMYRSDEQDP